ncbi:MAG: ATP-binding protein, partial [Pseudomonadota bacterium]
EILNVVASVLCRLTFDFGLWSRGTQPILLVCEEAHRYAPADANLGFEPTKRALARIAKEGRKYGISLCVVSQRPAEIAPAILSQCNTTVAFRMNSLRDQEIVRGIMADTAHGMLDFLPALGNTEAIVVGEGVPVPLRLRFRQLDIGERPCGGLRETEVETLKTDRQDFIAAVVARWRRQSP